MNDDLETIRWKAWIQWKQLCSWDRCDCSSKELLGQYVLERLKGSFIRQSSGGHGAEIRFEDFLPTAEGSEGKNLELAFKTIEFFFLGRDQIKGKQPKDWLFEGGKRSCVEGRVSSAIKNQLVRELRGASRKRIHRKTTSFPLQAEISQAVESGVSGDIIARIYRTGEASHKDLEEYAAAAAGVVDDCFAKLSREAKVAFLAKLSKISTDDKRITQAAGAERTKISKEWRQLNIIMQKAVADEEFSRDEIQEQSLFTRLLFEALGDKVRFWAMAENFNWVAFNEEGEIQ